MNNTERELKMSLTEREYETLLNVGGAEPQLQVNYYFYCDGMPDGVMVRIRFKSGDYLLCYKKLLSCENGVNVCDEREIALDETAALSFIEGGLTPKDINKLVGVEMPSKLQCAGSLSTYRARFALREWTVELDKNEYLGKTDYELECENESDEALKRLKDFLLDEYGVKFRSSVSKSGRFFKKYFSGE